jgi:hypothetical protein
VAYHQQLRQIVTCASLCQLFKLADQLDKIGHCRFVHSCCAAKFFNVSCCTSVLFGGIVAISLLPEGIKLMAKGHAGPNRPACAPPHSDIDAYPAAAGRNPVEAAVTAAPGYCGAE